MEPICGLSKAWANKSGKTYFLFWTMVNQDNFHYLVNANYLK